MNKEKMTNKKSIFRSHDGDVKEEPPESATVKKENSYYMDNYEATITVHKSPPQQRKQYFDFLEIDDETKEDTERVYPSYRLSKRKNLRVTFSDHIEVDVIEDFDAFENTFSEDEDTCVTEETIYEIPFDRSKGLKQITSSAEFKSVTEDISPRKSQSNISCASPRGKSNVSQTKNQSQLTNRGTPSPNISQPLLHKRKVSPKVTLSELEKKTREYVAKLEDKKAEVNARVAKALFPDITKKMHSQSNYKQFINSAKRAVEITRRYERPWKSGGATNQPSYHVWKRKNDAVHRTSSLPRNFRFTDDIPRPRSENVITGDNRHRIRNP